ncbi:hypothetical protein O9H85_05990 [Paenibacillus filicis]|uniref:Uncharacterized protein n=1 Tax=Paenibacillus gyeongsangnamensis TaxID=3388067 RepID=A0ABT4Q567_9BACL|nr:hypothetical protein [Paenibacillus filicis]MCZ8511981.1 hypothetical protein [Paenibacillus filicis]
MNLWKKAVSAVLISSLALTAGLPAALADSAPASAVDIRYPVVLEGALQVKVKSVLSEHTLSGTRIGVVVKLYNVWESTARVPDYELRVTTASGSSYTLKPSADNAVSVQGMSSVELSYMVQIDKADSLSVADLVWVDVNKDVYPKVETVKLDLPVSSLVWKGDSATVTAPEFTKAWGDSFTIPSLESPLVYKAVDLTKDYKGQNAVRLLKLLVHNPGSQSETVPAFNIDGKAGSQLFKGARADQSSITVDPNEDKYIYYSFQTDPDTELTGFTVSTTESFKAQGGGAVNYAIGRLALQTPGANAKEEQAADSTYIWNAPLTFDPVNKIVSPDLAVAVADFRLYENKGMGYQTGIVKLKLTNKGDKPVPVPQVAADLVSGTGFTYAGSRQAAAAQVIVPGTSYVVNYSFVLPLGDKGEGYTFKLSDDKTAAPYKSTVAQVKLNAQKAEAGSSQFLFYPFQIDLHSWSLTYMVTNAGGSQYNYKYKLKWDLDVKSADQVITDSSASKLLLELYTKDGRKIASQTLSVNGDGGVTNGEHTVYFTDTPTDQYEYPITLNIYETIDTPAGQARQLVGSLIQN